MDDRRNKRQLAGKSFEAFELSWDTEYFGIPSARVILKGEIDEREWEKLSQFLISFDFVTISNIKNNSNNNKFLGIKTSSFLTDMNVQFKKQVIDRPIDKETVVVSDYSYDDDMIAICEKAFKYSRFFNDPWLLENKSRDIYVHWAQSAFNKTDKYFVISKRQGRIAGFLLFSINSEIKTSVIELIAVDDTYRGQNVGKSLIAAMESDVKSKGIESVSVGTQMDNLIAINFYTSCGFGYAGCNSIYHYWPNKDFKIG